MDETKPGSEARERAAVAEVVASVLRHDLRNRFASIRNASYYLMRQTQKTELWKSDPRMEAFFQLIERELGNAEELLSNRAPLNAREQRGPVRLREVVERAFSRLAIPASIRVERTWQEHDSVEANEEDLVLLSRCLLENAVEAMPEGGLLQVRTFQGEGSGVILEVADSGPGLRPEQRTKVFEPFMTTKPGHSGLGLCIVQRLALRSGAWVELHPGEPGGVRARVVFPVEGTRAAGGA
jgi:signal transduction histidine kinase